MSKCLVTTIDVEVNNDYLPILGEEIPDTPVSPDEPVEELSEAALAIIGASGNDAMTDEQKSAINTLTYAIGSAQNNDTWSKVKILMLPCIAVSIDKAAINYVDNSDLMVSDKSNFSLNKGGVVATASKNFVSKSIGFVCDNKNFSTIFTYGNIDSSYTKAGFSIEQSSTYKISSVLAPSNPTTSAFVFGLGSNAVFVKDPDIQLSSTHAFSFAGDTVDDMSCYAVKDGDMNAEKYQVKMTVAQYQAVSMQSGILKIRASNNTQPMQSLVIGESLTNEELRTIAEAVASVVRAFDL